MYLWPKRQGRGCECPTGQPRRRWEVGGVSWAKQRELELSRKANSRSSSNRIPSTRSRPLIPEFFSLDFTSSVCHCKRKRKRQTGTERQAPRQIYTYTCCMCMERESPRQASSPPSAGLGLMLAPAGNPAALYATPPVCQGNKGAPPPS